MRIDRLTSKLQLALSDAQSLAVGLDHPAIEPAHLMQALLEQQGGSIKPLLMQVGFDVNSLRKELTKELDQLPKIQNPTGDVNMSQDLARLLNQADRLAQQKGDQYITSELVLLAAMDENSKLGKLLLGQGVSKKALENAINNLRGGEAVNDPNAEESRQALDKYTIDLTKRAEEGKLDPVIGRDDEIRRTIQVLQRRTKNNPVLIGEPGVGKTAIAEGLAQRIINGEVPDGLKGKRLLSLDIGALIAVWSYLLDGLFIGATRAREMRNAMLLSVGHLHPLPGGSSRHITGRLRVDGAAIHGGHAFTDTGQHAVFTQPHTAHMRGSRQHGDDQFSALGRLAGRVTDVPAQRGQLRQNVFVEIEQVQRVSGIEQVARHRCAHIAQTNKCDVHGRALSEG